MHDVYNKILNDLVSSENVEYFVKNGKYKEDGMGGLICNGLMYVGYPR